jgi:hypothetical protein
MRRDNYQELKMRLNFPIGGRLFEIHKDFKPQQRTDAYDYNWWSCQRHSDFLLRFFLLAATSQAVSGQTALAVFMLVGFALPFSYVTYGFVKDRRRKKTNPQ